MMSTKGATRALTGVCSTDCIMLLLNKTIFEIIDIDKINKEREALGLIIYNSIPSIKKNYTFSRVVKGAS